MGDVISAFFNSLPDKQEETDITLPGLEETVSRLVEGMRAQKEAIDSPAHYGGKGNVYEAINIIEAYNMDFVEGNVLKYLLRYKKKNGLEDLRKAKWYLERLIANEERERNGESS
jgi:hypothetical protein